MNVALHQKALQENGQNKLPNQLVLCSSTVTQSALARPHLDGKKEKNTKGCFEVALQKSGLKAFLP